MLTKIKSFFTNKKHDLDNDGKIESYREEIRGMLSQFKDTHDKLEEVNTKYLELIEDEVEKQEKERVRLEIVIANAEREKESSDKRISNAQMEIEVNVAVQEKVKDFIL